MVRIVRYAVVLVGGLGVLAVGAAAAGVQVKATVAPTAKSTAAASVQVPGLAATGTVQLPALNQLTVADLVAGFQQFLTQFGQTTATGALPTGLTTDQQQLLQGLQGQVDSEEINEEAFASQIHSLLGNLGSGQMFGVLGGLLQMQQDATTSDPLGLTADQQQQAQDIATRLHADIAQLRQQAHDQIVAVLTPDQQAQLTGTTSTATSGQSSSSKTPTLAKAVSKQTSSTSTTGTTATANTAGAGTSAATPSDTGAGWPNPLDALQLTDSQKAQIELIHEDLRAAIQARHQQARDEFFAILTPEQQALLYEQEQGPSQTAELEGTEISG